MDIEVFTSVEFSAVCGVGKRMTATPLEHVIEVVVIYAETERQVPSHENIVYTVSSGARCRMIKYYCVEEKSTNKLVKAKKMEVIFDKKDQYWNLYTAREFVTEWANLNDEPFIITKVEDGTYLCSVRRHLLLQMKDMGIPIQYELDTMTGEIIMKA